MDLLHCIQVNINKIKNQFSSIKANMYHPPKQFFSTVRAFCVKLPVN